MKIIVVKDENWFKKAPFADVKMVGIKHLGIPAEKFAGKQPEPFKRAMVRQVFAQKDLEYGIEFEIMEANNPFGQPKRRRSSDDSLIGTYSWVKNGTRAPEGDVRHDMMTVIERNTSFQDAIKDWEGEGHVPGEKYRSTGVLEFTFKGLVEWALKRGWIIKTGEE
jgi:hypothetical protein